MQKMPNLRGKYAVFVVFSSLLFIKFCEEFFVNFLQMFTKDFQSREQFILYKLVLFEL